MDGKKTGVFSTRSPYRPNPIGLSLAKLDKVEGKLLMISIHQNHLDLFLLQVFPRYGPLLRLNFRKIWYKFKRLFVLQADIFKTCISSVHLLNIFHILCD